MILYIYCKQSCCISRPGTRVAPPPSAATKRAGANLFNNHLLIPGKPIHLPDMYDMISPPYTLISS